MAKKGRTIKVDREASIEVLTRIVADSFFPGGISEEGQIPLSSLEYFIGKFDGSPLPAEVDGKAFTYDAFRTALDTTPVRLYFYTKVKEIKICYYAIINSDIIMLGIGHPCPVSAMSFQLNCHYF